VKDLIKKNSIRLVITLVFIIGILASCIIFKTIPDQGTDLNNVYYIFSTGAQTIAGLVGFVLAAYTFNHQFMWNVRENDDGKAEIIDEAIRQYYKYIMLLSVSTGVTLIADLFVLQFNAIITTVMKSWVYVIVGSMNVTIIIAAFLIALYIIRPINIEEWAQRMLEKLNEENVIIDSTVGIGQFIKKFSQLEQVCRDYLYKNNDNPQSPSMMAMAKKLYQRANIGDDVYQEFKEVSKYRNLVVHGHVSQVDQEMYSRLNKLYNLIDERLNRM